MVIKNGSNFETVHHAENSNGGEGRSIANIAIMAVRNDGESFLETEKETEKQTQKKTQKKTEKKTEKTEAVDDGTTDPGTDAAEDGGCRGMIALPAVIATSGLAVVGFSKKRGEKKKKDKK
jgi:hypothetical protein